MNPPKNVPIRVTELKTNVSPSKRSSFGLCKNKQNIYIYGGIGNQNEYLDDFWHMNGIQYMCVYVQ